MGAYIIISIILVSIIGCYVSNIKSDQEWAENKQKEAEKRTEQLINSLQKFSENFEIVQSHPYKFLEALKRIKDCINGYKRNIYETKEKNRQLCSLLNDFEENINSGFKKLSEFSADLETIIYYNSAEYLDNKSHPAHKEALRIRDLQIITQEYLKQKKQMEYKYEYLLGLFPELEAYVDDLDSLNKYKNNLNDLKDDYDEVLQWINKEEYKKLPEDERNQLALDNYIKSSRKSNWDIGRDYEMYCSYYLEKMGFSVERTGIELKLQDLGRDIIAYKDQKIYIIQCKYWSKDKLIHEKHIAQLYGTTVQYKIEHHISDSKNFEVIPLFITNIQLSEMAKKFAAYLGVGYEEGFSMQDFPRIKCNNNHNEYGIHTKIYHLPMDQQYDRTKITKENGDFYAFTVKEAVEAGYRRARKHIF